jgi:hypothetical protein
LIHPDAWQTQAQQGIRLGAHWAARIGSSGQKHGGTNRLKGQNDKVTDVRDAFGY